MTAFQWAFILIAFCALFISVIILKRELDETKRRQRAAISLQLYQQLRDPMLQAAMSRVRSKTHAALSVNGNHAMNGNVSGSLPEIEPAMAEVYQYFSTVGRMLRRRDADGEILALMGPAISEMWHSLTPVRPYLEEQHNDDFTWLYAEWLNYDYGRRDHWSTLSTDKLTAASLN